MLILMDDSERGLDVARGVWGAFTSCLYLKHDCVGDSSLWCVIESCAKSFVSLIVVTEEVDDLKNSYPDAFCIFCDGSNGKAGEGDLIFSKDEKRDKIVTSIITYFVRKKLL